jgi:SAM-dependent methyltransferase
MGVDDLRAVQRTQWAAAATAWAQLAALVDEQGTPVTEALLRLATPEPGDRVLELAAGPGGVGLEAAAYLGGRGEVVISDVAAEMVAVAAGRARERGLEAVVSVRTLDLEAIDEPDGSFDVVLSRMGLMLVPEPERAASEIARVLEPGARAAVAVWAAREANPWLAVLLDAIGSQFGATIPPPGVPGPFSLGDAGRLAEVLGSGRLEDVAVEEVPVPMRLPSAEAWWDTVPALGGPLAQMLAALQPADREAIRARALDGIGDFARPDGTIEAPGLALVASGRRP